MVRLLYTDYHYHIHGNRWMWKFIYYQCIIYDHGYNSTGDHNTGICFIIRMPGHRSRCKYRLHRLVS